MTVRIEFLGIPRERAGCPHAAFEAATLGELFDAAGARFPEFAAACLEGHRLREGYLATVNGRTFTADSATPLVAGDCVLVLSSDAGG